MIKSSALFNFHIVGPSHGTDNKQQPTTVPLNEEKLQEHTQKKLSESTILGNLTETLESRTNEFIVATSSQKKICPRFPPHLCKLIELDRKRLIRLIFISSNTVGRLKVLTDIPTFENLEDLFPEVELGGRFRPKECQTRHYVAIIIPYRDREEHLRTFLFNLHPFLMRQQINYGIYVIEQVISNVVALLFLIQLQVNHSLYLS